MHKTFVITSFSDSALLTKFDMFNTCAWDGSSFCVYCFRGVSVSGRANTCTIFILFIDTRRPV